MSKYKVGDKFVCEIKEVIKCERGTLYRSNFSTLVFDDNGLDNLIKLPDDIITKLKEWEEEEKIKVGDEVQHLNLSGTYYGVVLEANSRSCRVIWNNATVTWNNTFELAKTGRNLKFKLEELLEELRKETK